MSDIEKKETAAAEKKPAARPKKKEESFRFYRVVRAVLTPLIRLLWPTEIVHKERFDEMQGGLVVCNHYAIPDTLIPVAQLYIYARVSAGKRNKLVFNAHIAQHSGKLLPREPCAKAERRVFCSEAGEHY